MEQVHAIATELGQAVAGDQNIFAELLTELVAGRSDQLWHFGRGLAEAANERRAVWDQSVAQLGGTPSDKQSVQLFRGFLNALSISEIELVSALLDDSVESEVLGPWYPVLQASVGIDTIGAERLTRSLDVGKAGIRMYRILMAGGLTNQLSGADFNRLLSPLNTNCRATRANLHSEGPDFVILSTS